MPFQGEFVLIDGRHHLLGRLASIVAKELLQGQNVVVVRCEEINISGSLFRNHLKWKAFIRKRHLTNPKKGPIHYKSPSRILWRVVRGMVPHKTVRGAEALGRLKVFEGVPFPYDKMKKQVVPAALKNQRLKPGRDFCRVGDLATLAGWKHEKLITQLEDKRKAQGSEWYKQKKALAKLREKAVASVADAIKPHNEALAQFGF